MVDNKEKGVNRKRVGCTPKWEYEQESPGVPKINSIWFVIDLRDNPVKNNSIMRMKLKSKVSKNYMDGSSNHDYKYLGNSLLDGYSDMKTKRTLCEL